MVNKRILENRICKNCNSNNTFVNNKGWSYWYRYEDGYLCKSCYMKLINNPKWQKIHSKIYSPRRFTFKGLRIRLPENIRKGHCTACNKNIGDKFINRFGNEDVIKATHIHHIQYYNNNPLKMTVELCPSCHSKITRREQLIRNNVMQRRLL